MTHKDCIGGLSSLFGGVIVAGFAYHNNALAPQIKVDRY